MGLGTLDHDSATRAASPPWKAPEVGGSQLTFRQLLAELGAWGLSADGRRPFSAAMPFGNDAGPPEGPGSLAAKRAGWR